jgi:hypothetical protein
VVLTPGVALKFVTPEGFNLARIIRLLGWLRGVYLLAYEKLIVLSNKEVAGKLPYDK